MAHATRIGPVGLVRSRGHRPGLYSNRLGGELRIAGADLASDTSEGESESGLRTKAPYAAAAELIARANLERGLSEMAGGILNFTVASASGKTDGKHAASCGIRAHNLPLTERVLYQLS